MRPIQPVPASFASAPAPTTQPNQSRGSLLTTVCVIGGTVIEVVSILSTRSQARPAVPYRRKLEPGVKPRRARALPSHFTSSPTVSVSRDAAAEVLHEGRTRSADVALAEVNFQSADDGAALPVVAGLATPNRSFGVDVAKSH